MNKAKISFLEVIIGIWAIAVLVVLAGVFFVLNPLAYVLGAVVGSAVSSALMFHLYSCIDHEMDLPRKKAINHSRIMGTVRSLIEIGVLFGSFYVSNVISPYTVFAGLLARKFAALLVPLMEKIRTRGNKTDLEEMN